MTIHERLETFWSGGKPDRIPFTIYQNEWRHTQDDPAWGPLFEAGLGVTWHLPPFRSETRSLTTHDVTGETGGVMVRRQTLRTDAGEVWQTWKNGWHDEYLLKTEQDYRIMTEIVRNTVWIEEIEEVKAKSREIAPFGVPLLGIGRTPLQTIMVDYAGLENFALHLADFEEEVRALYGALLDQFRQKVGIVRRAPGRFVANLENFTAESLGPGRYREFLLPVYEECFPILQEAGKIVGCHYDGRTSSCRELIAGAPMNLIESLTEPPEGDQTLAEAREAWPDKLFWCNIRVSDYELPPARLRDKVLALVGEGSVGGRLLAFEVSEQYPANWRDSLPVVLDALRETGSP